MSYLDVIERDNGDKFQAITLDGDFDVKLLIQLGDLLKQEGYEE